MIRDGPRSVCVTPPSQLRLAGLGIGTVGPGELSLSISCCCLVRECGRVGAPSHWRVSAVVFLVDIAAAAPAPWPDL
jgi:hypothetical protein